MPLSNSQALVWLGVACSILFVGYFLVKGRKNVVTLALLVISITSVLFIATEWYGRAPSGLPVLSISQVSVPTAFTHLLTLLASSVAGLFLLALVGLVFLLARLQRHRRREAFTYQTQPHAPHGSYTCPECEQTGRRLREYRYRTERGVMLWSKLCEDCAGRLNAKRA